MFMRTLKLIPLNTKLYKSIYSNSHIIQLGKKKSETLTIHKFAFIHMDKTGLDKSLCIDHLIAIYMLILSFDVSKLYYLSCIQWKMNSCARVTKTKTNKLNGIEFRLIPHFTWTPS